MVILSFPYTMGRVGFCLYVILPALVLSTDSEVAVHDGWSELGGGFLAKIMLQTPHLSEIGPSLSVPFPIWNLVAVKSNFNLSLMNSSWSGPAKTNIYRKGESVYLQVFTSAAPDQELYIQSCYATSSSDPMDKSRSALILNNGCVSSKLSAMEFVSRQGDSINLLLDTSRLKFSQIYVHCSVVHSSAVSPNTKSCNYNKSKSSWVELSGQTSVCKCCASKCKGPPSYGGPSNELKALVSTGPLTFREKQEKESSLLSFFNTTSQVGFSTGTNQTASGTFWKSSVEKKQIVASGTLSDTPKKRVSYGSPWLSQSAASESVTLVSRGNGSALSLWLPGLLMDVVPDPGLEMVIEMPQQESTVELGVSGRDKKAHSKTTSEGTHREVNDWRSLIPDRVSEVYMADSPGLTNDWDLADVAFEGFHSPEEELRGDVFTDYKWPQRYDPLNGDVHVDALTSPLLEKLPETSWEKRDEVPVLEQTEEVLKKSKKDEFGSWAYVKKTKLTFSQDAGGSSSLSYEKEEERRPSVGEQEVRTSKLGMEWGKVNERGTSEKLEKDLIQSVLDLVRSLNKTMDDQ